MTSAYQPQIRAATLDDAEVLAELSERTFLETFVTGGFRIPYPEEDLRAFLEEVYSIEVTARRLADPAHHWEIAEIDGRAVAFCEVGPATMPHDDCRPEHGEIRRLYVAKEAQGLGLGTALLERALARMDQSPGPQWLSVWSGNEKAQKLYRHYGFDKVGEYGFPVGEWRDHEFIFRRERP